VGPSDLVPFAQIADAFLVVRDGRIRLLDGVTVHPVSTVDGSLAAGRVDIPDGAGALVTDDPELVALTEARATLADAAQLIGLGRRMLDLTTAYVSARRQFGAPVGSFQAVAHPLADALLRLEFAAPAVLAAGWALATEPATRTPHVDMAAVLATEAAREVARTAIQCHGAIGYTVEYDLHLYAKRAWALAARTDLDAHLDRLADHLDLKGDPR
jgi:alkylation response protein AidB-like acyl-CoA dehydrogenase